MRSRTLVATGIAVAVIGVAGVAGAGVGIKISGGGKGDDRAQLSCPGGMSRLAHPWGYGMSIFEGDPETTVTIVNTIEPDGYLLEQVSTGVHTGTHLDAPGHFVEGGRTVDQLQAQEFVWPAYVIDVRARMAAATDDGFQLTIDDIKAVERSQGKIPKGAMVIIQTGFDAKFGTAIKLTARIAAATPLVPAALGELPPAREPVAALRAGRPPAARRDDSLAPCPR